MKYVLDSSAALSALLPEPFSPNAIRPRDDYRHAIHDLIAPDIFPAELFNALLKAERTRRISVGDAKNLYATAGSDRPVLHLHLPLLNRAGDIASRYRVALYDCPYLALAEQESCEMVTADSKFVNALQFYFPQIIHLSSMP